MATKKRITNTLSLFDLMTRYPTKESPIRYLERIRWGDTPVCMKCGGMEKITAQKKVGQYWRGDCRGYFNAWTGTPLEHGRIGPSKWLFTAYLLMAARKGISAI